MSEQTLDVNTADATSMRVSTQRRFKGAALIRAALLASILLAVSYVWYLGWEHNRRIGAENGPLEWAQIGMLACAAAICLANWLRSRPIEHRICWFGAGLLSVSIIVRELDIAEFPIGGATQLELLLRLAVVAAWIALAWWTARNGSVLRTLAKAMLFSWSSMLLMAGIALYISTWPFDHIKFTDKNTSRFIEELIEFHATALLLLSALTARAAVTRASVEDGR